MSLVARHLETNGIPTVVVGAARDIAEECGVPRFLFSDLRLGNPCGRPFEREMQPAITSYAVEVLESATLPRTKVQTPFRWSYDDFWKEAYARIDETALAELRRAGNARRARQAKAKKAGRLR